MTVERIVFLDIDGPMIPSGMYLIEKRCSFERNFSPIPVAVVNRICEDSGAKIVMNTTHNIHGATMLSDVVREGIKVEYMHEELPMTCYPKKTRWWAIQHWIKTYGKPDNQIDWVALDDAEFTQDKRLIWVDFDTGLTPGHYNQVAERWGLKKILIL